MNHDNCLNCGTPLTGKFCSECGQKADTHRITFKHFIMHDVLHGVWHFEKGMLFTAKEALLRPGKAALDYIGGKRIRYYNVFYFILLLIGLNFFLSHYYEQIEAEYNPASSVTTHIKNNFEKFMTANAKSIILSFVPFLALSSFTFFRRKKFNISEHFIIAGITFLGILLFVITLTLLGFSDFVKHLDFVVYAQYLILPLILIYTIRSYYSAFKDDYTLLGFSFRMLFFLLFLLFEFIALIIIIFGYVTDWKFGSFSYHS